MERLGWIMVDIYYSRRGYNYKCFYWKRDESGVMDNETLIHEKKPDGIFYAKIASSRSNDKQDVVGVFRVGIEGVSIETNDNVSLNKDDLVQFNGDVWLVGRVNNTPIQRNAEFGHNTSVKTTIELNKGC